jgi:hypothetical protein
MERHFSNFNISEDIIAKNHNRLLLDVAGLDYIFVGDGLFYSFADKWAL